MSSELCKKWESAGGKNPNGWPIVPLESLLKDNKGIVVGVMYPGNHTSGGSPLIKVGDIRDGQVVSRPSFLISPETNYEYRRSALVGDELLITLVGNPGECVVVKPEMAGWNPARAIAVIRLSAPELRTYLKAVIESSAGKHLIDSVLNTTVQKTLNLKDIRQLPIPMPDRSVIKGISTISEAITDRVTLLRETNKTLESIAQAIFKSWFVDFDPVHAKAKGLAPVGMDEATAALFPDSFEETELGMVPKGWTIGTLNDLSNLNPESWTTKKHLETIVYLDLANVKENQITNGVIFNFDDAPSRARRVLRDGDTIVGTVRPGNRSFAFIRTPPDGATGSTGFAVLRPKNHKDAEYVYLSATQDFSIKHLEHLADGAAYPAVRPDVVSSLSCVVPERFVLDAFHTVCVPLMSRMNSNNRLSQVLAEIRDTLLPRLISGQLRIEEAQEMVESV